MNTYNEFGITLFQYRENEDTEILFASLCLLYQGHRQFYIIME